MKPHILETTTLIPRPLSEVFAFFSKAENLNLLTPPALQFRILTPIPVQMQKGTLIDYKLSLNGIPFGWNTEICEWQPPYRFADRQLKGPYRLWYHIHTFREENGVTVMTDRVEFLSPGGILEPLIHRLFVGRKVREIFAFREAAMKKLFPADPSGA
jgi:ligand-binding SRPBCC domain-containing protein